MGAGRHPIPVFARLRVLRFFLLGLSVVTHYLAQARSETEIHLIVRAPGDTQRPRDGGATPSSSVAAIGAEAD